MRTAKVELCGEVFGSMTSMPCSKLKGHDGLHQGHCATKGSVGNISWLVEIREVPAKKGKRK